MVSTLCCIFVTVLVVTSYSAGAAHAAEEGALCVTLTGGAGRCLTLKSCVKSFLAAVSSSAGLTRPSALAGREPTFSCTFPLICCEAPSAVMNYNMVRTRNALTRRHDASVPLIKTTSKPEQARPATATLQDPRLARLPLDTCGLVDSQDFILSGKHALPGQFPWIVMLCYNRSTGRPSCTCAGSLISERYVVTAAHCMSHFTSNTTMPKLAVLGEVDKDTDPDCSRTTQECAPPVQRIEIEHVVVHPRYLPARSKQNDIAVIRLARPANISTGTVRPVCLPLGKLQLKSLTTVPELIVAGWGNTDVNAEKSMSRVLMFAGVREVPLATCREAHRRSGQSITASQLCASKPQRGSCRGDSGGPLIMLDTVPWSTDETRAVLVGVVSFGPVPCASPGLPSVFTRVSHFLDWILSNIT